ncbi:hypothetical protein RRG08_058204 [Elysia crispata]|uniref:Uncharacterized protein n=1 Tax=Elysia crispata TaxID=231223 RepID=A0AAE1E6H5_9GAST|nr:hypothetical protein RRG08_058204 [Elysia crispata]
MPPSTPSAHFPLHCVHLQHQHMWEERAEEPLLLRDQLGRYGTRYRGKNFKKESFNKPNPAPVHIKFNILLGRKTIRQPQRQAMQEVRTSVSRRQPA